VRIRVSVLEAVFRNPARERQGIPPGGEFALADRFPEHALERVEDLLLDPVGEDVGAEVGFGGEIDEHGGADREKVARGLGQMRGAGGGEFELRDVRISEGGEARAGEGKFLGRKLKV
jgi:hypothetical protein